MNDTKVLVTEGHLEAIGYALRAKRHTDATYLPEEMAPAIMEIHDGYGELKPMHANANGAYLPGENVSGFYRADVDVPTLTGYIDGDAVVLDGDGVEYDPADATVIIHPTYAHKTIAANGDYYPADDGADAYSGVSVNVVPRLYILNPDMLDDLTVNADNSGSDGSTIWFPSPCFVRANSPRWNTFATQAAAMEAGNVGVLVRRSDTTNAIIAFAARIPRWRYTKLCIRLRVDYTGGTYGQNRLFLSDASGTSSRNAPAGNILRTVMLTNKDYTAAQINGQSGVTIHTEDGKVLAEQLVTVDISGINTPFFVSVHNISSDIYIREIYAEV